MKLARLLPAKTRPRAAMPPCIGQKCTGSLVACVCFSVVPFTSPSHPKPRSSPSVSTGLAVYERFHCGRYVCLSFRLPSYRGIPPSDIHREQTRPETFRYRHKEPRRTAGVCATECNLNSSGSSGFVDQLFLANLVLNGGIILSSFIPSHPRAVSVLNVVGHSGNLLPVTPDPKTSCLGHLAGGKTCKSVLNVLAQVEWSCRRMNLP